MLDNPFVSIASPDISDKKCLSYCNNSSVPSNKLKIHKEVRNPRIGNLEIEAQKYRIVEENPIL